MLILVDIEGIENASETHSVSNVIAAITRTRKIIFKPIRIIAKEESQDPLLSTFFDLMLEYRIAID